MCLTLRKRGLNKKPYDNKRIRYKLATRFRCGSLQSPFEGMPYVPGKWMRARGDARDTSVTGFHCFVSKADAKGGGFAYNANVLMKVEVKGFLRSGDFGWREVSGQCVRRRCETWRYMRILSVHKRTVDHDI